MPDRWPADTVCTRLALAVEEPWGRTCGGALTICDPRPHHVCTLHGPVHLVCKLAHGAARACPAGPQTISPEAETTIPMPWWVLGWEVVWWLGHRRFAPPWSVPQLRAALADPSHMPLSDDAIERSIHRSHQRRAARHRDPQPLAAAYAQVDTVILASDGRQPEQGQETLSVVRALERTRVGVAEARLASATTEVQPLLVQARTWAERFGKPVRLWMSDQQEACVRGMAAEFPRGPHRYGAHHVLREVAKPVWEAHSRAKVRLRRPIRGVRTIARAVLAAQRVPAPTLPPTTHPGEPPTAAPGPSGGLAEEAGREVVLDYGAATRGILHDDQGGPLQPPG